MSYNIYLVETIGFPRNHHALFVETHESGTGSGHIFQVTGTIQNGMTFEKKPGEKPEDNAIFIRKGLLGTVLESNYSKIEEVCRTVDPPKKQFDGPKRLFPSEALRRCNEWTAEAIIALKAARVMES